MELTKGNLIDAYEHTLDLYVNDEHDDKQTQCAKCRLVGNNCNICPEYIHMSNGNTNAIRMGCLNRFNKSKESEYLTKDEKANVIKYHTEAIEYLKIIKRYSFDRFKNKLLKIDKSIT